ncbi:acylneuraminate cytidylyltransferase family protein [Helicobacter equorum]|uniref:acylneuraminate cytidylyltransferase family protein n=1 Tax=Helicobacter equorum TaxID=361872 RepID=UPI000CF1AEDB|nr:acylneuraminate cytidylyltransferase [Helicobacter equorum]
MEINVFLPCRKGSERVPNRNIKPFGCFANGLLELKLSQLLAVHKISRIFVSSNDDEVLNFAKNLKSNKIVLGKRDESLCMDSTQTDELIVYAHQLINNGEILWTHVTAPFFDHRCYDDVIEKYEQCLYGGYDSLMSVNRVYGFLWGSKGPINYDRTLCRWPQTQRLAPLYEVNSAVFLANAEMYKQHHDRIGEMPYFYITDKITGFDVDWREDFLIVKALFESSFASDFVDCMQSSPRISGGGIHYNICHLETIWCNLYITSIETRIVLFSHNILLRNPFSCRIKQTDIALGCAS